MHTDSVPGRPDPIAVDRAHKNLQRLTGTCISHSQQKCSVPDRHHGHDVDRIQWISCRTPQIFRSDPSLVLGPDYDPAGDAIHETPVVGDYGWGPVDQGVEPEDGEPAQEG
ncbi:hypothetical protein AAC387_Pa08g0742 [Persea americana]